jgi:hypothetical protein
VALPTVQYTRRKSLETAMYQCSKLRIYKQRKRQCILQTVPLEQKEAQDKRVVVVFQENVKYGGRINMIHSFKKKVLFLRQK